jgi:predicted Zn-dependent protease
MDTLGWLLVENGNLERGTQLLRNAVERAPAGDAIRLNLAKALLRSGNKAGARKELELLAKRGDAFGGQGEVKKLLQDL